MPSCSAINCSNRTEQNVRLFRFPADKERKRKWLHHMRRADWNPSSSSRICEVHFEESQFESKRADGWKKLKLNAIPTLFEVPNPPPSIEPSPQKSTYKKRIGTTSANERLVNTVPSQDNSMLDSTSLYVIENHVIDNTKNTSENEHVDNLSLEEKVAKLQRENEELKRQLQDARTTCHAIEHQENQELIIEKETLAGFLNEYQMKLLQQGRVTEWSDESIIMALEFKFPLSVHGFHS